MKCFWENRTITMTKAKDTGMMHRATKVSCQLMESIMISTPTRVQTEVISWVTLWFRELVRVSTSLVIRESTSPWLTRLK